MFTEFHKIGLFHSVFIRLTELRGQMKLLEAIFLVGVLDTFVGSLCMLAYDRMLDKYAVKCRI